MHIHYIEYMRQAFCLHSYLYALVVFILICASRLFSLLIVFSCWFLLTWLYKYFNLQVARLRSLWLYAWGLGSVVPSNCNSQRHDNGFLCCGNSLRLTFAFYQLKLMCLLIACWFLHLIFILRPCVNLCHGILRLLIKSTASTFIESIQWFVFCCLAGRMLLMCGFKYIYHLFFCLYMVLVSASINLTYNLNSGIIVTN